MNINEKNFLKVVSSVVQSTELNLEEPIDYLKILKVSESQKLFPLVFEKLCDKKSFINSPEYLNYSKAVMCSVVFQAQSTSKFLYLYDILQKNDLKPIVVKGIVCRNLYGKYEDHRPSGDEDIIVKKEDFFKACKILEDNGYEPSHKVSLAELENLQALSFLDSSGSHIEVHHNPIGRENKLKNQMDSYFHDIFDDSIKMEINGTNIYTMDYSKHFIFLIFHAFKHFIGSGFGVRQVLDILMYERAYEDKIDWRYIKTALKDTGTEKFFSDVIELGNRYMGFNLTQYGPVCCPDELLGDLLSNGIFGNDTPEKLMAGSITSVAVDNTESTGKSSNLLKTIFPSQEYMKKRNPELNERPWLLPLRVVQRWFTFIEKYKKSNGTVASQSVAIGNRRIELLKKYGIVK